MALGGADLVEGVRTTAVRRHARHSGQRNKKGLAQGPWSSWSCHLGTKKTSLLALLSLSVRLQE